MRVCLVIYCHWIFAGVQECLPYAPPDEATELLKIITDYTYALDMLDKYDHQLLKIELMLFFTPFLYDDICLFIVPLLHPRK